MGFEPATGAQSQRLNHSAKLAQRGRDSNPQSLPLYPLGLRDQLAWEEHMFVETRVFSCGGIL